MYTTVPDEMFRHGDTNDIAEESAQDLFAGSHQSKIDIDNDTKMSSVEPRFTCRTRAKLIRPFVTVHSNVSACCGNVSARNTFFHISTI
jgi:hypothetical protein